MIEAGVLVSEELATYEEGAWRFAEQRFPHPNDGGWRSMDVIIGTARFAEARFLEALWKGDYDRALAFNNERGLDPAFVSHAFSAAARRSDFAAATFLLNQFGPETIAWHTVGDACIATASEGVLPDDAQRKAQVAFVVACCQRVRTPELLNSVYWLAAKKMDAVLVRFCLDRNANPYTHARYDSQYHSSAFQMADGLQEAQSMIAEKINAAGPIDRLWFKILPGQRPPQVLYDAHAVLTGILTISKKFKAIPQP